MYNLKDLSTRVSKRVGINNKDSIELTTVVFEELTKILVEEKEEVRIKNFGSFKFGKISGRKTKHPSTKEEIIIDDNITIRLALANKMKKSLRA